MALQGRACAALSEDGECAPGPLARGPAAWVCAQSRRRSTKRTWRALGRGANKCSTRHQRLPRGQRGLEGRGPHGAVWVVLELLLQLGTEGVVGRPVDANVADSGTHPPQVVAVPGDVISLQEHV